MLSTHLAWLSDAYKPTLVQEEKILKQLEAFGRVEKTGCGSGNQNVSQLLDASHAGRKPRVHSAPIQHTCRERQTFSGLTGDGAKTVSVEVPRRPSSANFVSSGKQRNQPIAARIKETANLRFHFTQAGTSPRPTSGHARPLGRPRTAWGVQKREQWHPLDKLSVLSRTFADGPDSAQPPPSPADSGFSLDTSTLSSDEDKPRDIKESKKNVPRIVVQSSESACSSGSQTPSGEELSPWLEDPRVGLSIGYESDPRVLYFDRHTRCRGKGVDGHPLSKWRPRDQRGSNGSLSSSGPWLAPRLRPASGRSDPGKHNSKVQRYVDCHRPQTAPSTRKDLQGLVVSDQHEYLPHYCSFVRGIPLQGRSGQENEADDGYITNSEQSPKEADLQSRKVRSFQGARAGHGNGGSKHVGPNSPSSVVSPGNGQLPGTTSDLTPAVVEKPDPEINPDPQGVLLEKEGTVTSPPLLEEDSTESVAEGSRQPIQIPTHVADSDVIESARPKFEETVDLVELLTSNKVRDTKGLTRTPLASAKTRRACPKKGKMPGKTRKRRSRKKGSKETEEDGEKVEAAQSEEQHNDGGLASGVSTALSYDLQVPDLPELDLSQQGHTKGNRGKTKKTPIGAPVLLDKTVEQVVPDEPIYNFYDFGDLAAATAAMEENTTPKSTAGAPASVNDRMVLSLQSSRFELPMDMRKLEKLTPQDYLRKYCVITTRRRSLYQKMYQKHRGKAGHIQGKFQLCEAFKDVLVNTITYSQAEELCDLLEVDDETCVDFELFSGMAALAERILYPDFLTDATADQAEYQKEKVECADFSALEWKLHGVNVSQPVRKILSSL